MSTKKTNDLHTDAPLRYSRQVLTLGGVRLDALAEKYGTPLYVYSLDYVLAQAACYQRAFGALPHVVCYAVKANSSLGHLAGTDTRWHGV